MTQAIIVASFLACSCAATWLKCTDGEMLCWLSKLTAAEVGQWDVGTVAFNFGVHMVCCMEDFSSHCSNLLLGVALAADDKPQWPTS